MGAEDADVVAVKKILVESFEIMDLGIASHFLGIQISRGTDGSITLSQKTYINGIVSGFEHQATRPVSTPIDASGVPLRRSKELSTAEERKVMALKLYRELTGSVAFAAVKARPDISGAVSFWGQRVADPRPGDLTAGRRLMRYLKGTTDFAFKLPAGGI